jgi:intracellular multiplication protein IcmK
MKIVVVLFALLANSVLALGAPTSAGLTAAGQSRGETPLPAVPQTGQAEQWVRSGNTFPPPPDRLSATAVPLQNQQTNYEQGNYLQPAGPAANLTRQGSDQNGIAPQPPLAPPKLVPPNTRGRGEAAVSPFSPAEIVRMRQKYDTTRKAKAYRPVRTVPRISSLTVDLSPGAALPIARMLPGEMSTVLFLDASGAAWPLAAAPRVSDARYFDAEWLQGTATVVLSALSPYEDGNLSVMLQGFPTPVVIKLVTGEPDTKERSRIVDYRLDLRIPGRAPGTPTGLVGPGKIALYDETMQRFLDGLPPSGAKTVKADPALPVKTQVWTLNGALFVRTGLDIQTAFDQSIAAGDGTRVYRLAPTPYVTLSDRGRSITLQLDID